ncbi:MAG TPA: signal peptidase I [Terracidiphilus sp.]|jgi:signal peptidase I
MGKNIAGARDTRTPHSSAPDSAVVKETPFEAVASICSVLVVGLFILTFLGQNFVIPSGSMERTLLVGDHLLVDRLTLSPPSLWMPLVHYREPRRGDIVVFIKPVANSAGEYLYLVKRLIGIPGDRIHLHEGIVYVNGSAQPNPAEGDVSPASDPVFLDEFPSVSPTASGPDGTPEAWAVDFHNHIQDGDLVVPSGQYFMMGDHRHGSLDSRFWGFVPRENVVGRPILNYWSFKTPDDLYEKQGLINSISWIGHVAVHFFSDTRWHRTLKRVK